VSAVAALAARDLLGNAASVSSARLPGHVSRPVQETPWMTMDPRIPSEDANVHLVEGGSPSLSAGLQSTSGTQTHRPSSGVKTHGTPTP
jgi:hypothetical protein